jgi:hypothetical protein
MLSTQLPFAPYTDLDGKPLDTGYLYFGTAGQNPETSPITVYWDLAGTIPAAQPIRTLAGFPVNNGRIAHLYRAADYSITVKDRFGRLVYSSLTSLDYSNDNVLQQGLAAVYTDLANTANAAKNAGLIGFNPLLNYAAGTLGASERLRVHVKQFAGVVGDGVADDTTAVQAALNFMSLTRGGGILEAEGCRLRLTAKLTIPSFVLFRGASWLPDPSNTAQSLHTSLYIDWGSNADNHAVEMSHSSGLEGFTFFYPGQVAKTAATPIPFGFAISTPTAASVYDNIHLKNITLYNAYKGIRLNNGGRWRVENVQGDPLSLGFTADQCLDTCYMSGVHFWNFYTQAAALETWVAANGTAFEFRRIDQLFASKLMVWNRAIAYYCRDSLWANFTDIVCDRANTPFLVEQSAQVEVTGFVFICNGGVRPAIWGRNVGESCRFSNGRITTASSVGVQIEDGASYSFDSVDFDCPHTCLVNQSTTTEVRISDTCRWNVPPWGTYSTFVAGQHLPGLSTAVTLPAAATTGTGISAIAGGYRFDLNNVTTSTVSWETTLIGERCGLHILEFDYLLNGGFPTTWYFQFSVASDVGANAMVQFTPTAPLLLNPTAVNRKVRIPFHINHSRFKQLALISVTVTLASPGTSLDITNLVLYEQSSALTTDAQISMMMSQGYCLDGFGKGQTLSAKGKARRIVTEPEAGIGRAGATPIAGTWQVGDEVLLDTPVAGGSPGVVCTTAGTFGGVAPTFRALPALA